MKLLHAYYDLMNLYGDYANITVLERHLLDQGFAVTVDRLTVGDQIAFDAYDFIFIGSGTESNQKAVLSDLLPQKEAFGSAVRKGAVILLTGNAFEVLGKSVKDASGKDYGGLGLLEFTVSETDRRITGDAVLSCSAFSGPLVGFINKCTLIEGVSDPLFTVEMGPGNRDGDNSEGVCLENLFGTHLTGPALVKNPPFLNHILTLLGKRENPDFKPLPVSYPYEQAAYEITLRELKNRIAGGKSPSSI